LGAEVEVAKFDLSLGLMEEGGQVFGSLSYNTDLFDASTVDRLLGHLSGLLDAVTEHPGRPFHQAPLLTPAERHCLLAEWNDTGALRSAPPVHQLIAEQAARTPEAVAVSSDGAGLSYRELDERANHLAGFLQELGVGPEVRVGLCLDRSLEMIVGLLAVLKAGGAYVPLDPSYPRERLAYILEAARVPVLLTQTRWTEALPAAGPRVVCLDAGGPQSGRRSTPPAVEVAPESLAYVIFTSGSTGRPKGVMVRHEGLSNHMLWMQRRFPLRPADRVLQKTPFGFDASVWEIFAPLMAGAWLVMARPEGHRDPAYLVRALAEERISVLQVVPSMLSLILAEDGLERCAALRQVCCGGEALTPDLARRLAARWNVELVNLYGPTEATIQMAFWTCPPGAVPALTPLGRLIDNARAYVLDRHGEPAPAGVPGELVLGGVCLGRGYLDRPDLTAGRFVPDPFGGAGMRLYRTGDLARWRVDGQLEYLGRLDHQLKVRGFRIELGEIEAALASQPGVRAAVALARQEAAGDLRLVAYVVPDGGARLTAAGLRSSLREVLPEPMVPSAFVVLESLPLTPNGKVDRKGLPEPGRAAADDEFVAPRTPVEEMLAGIWCEVLGLERVGVDASFFDLGGHSLLATQVMSRVRRLFGVELPLRVLFEAPTVAALAQAVEQARRAGRGALAPAIVPVPRTGAERLSFAQQRLWFLDRLEPDSPAYNIPVALRVEGRLRVDVLERALGEVVRRHEALRTSFGEVDGEPVQVIAAAGALSLPVVDLAGLPRELREAEASRRIAEEALRPFALSRGPLLRAALLRLGAEEHAALLTMHHIVSDGWSMQVLVEEIGALYAAFAEGRPAPLPELPVQYADYAAWQRSWLSGGVLEAELGYWRGRLAGLPPQLELPTDRPRPAVQSHRGAVRPLALDPALSERLAALSRREGATPFMTLLAGWQALLGRWAGSEDLAVGTPIAGRNRQETEKLIGLFVNTLVLRGDLSGGPSFQELLGRVRQASLEAHEHQEIPFERLVEELAPERSLSHTPLFQVLFVLQNVPRRALDLPGLRLAPLGAEVGTAKFDLSLGLTEEGGQIFGGLSYNTDLFDAATADRLLAHL
ncbi:MAG TPA: amino acid adenylation domain-containing protein, partial [Thermoanaerobaculia bacterium]|nr:amino acid adenylation domain-containing protein [Thermoanaerobaculia bacterium]